MKILHNLSNSLSCFSCFSLWGQGIEELFLTLSKDYKDLQQKYDTDTEKLHNDVDEMKKINIELQNQIEDFEMKYDRI